MRLYEKFFQQLLTLYDLAAFSYIGCACSQSALMRIEKNEGSHNLLACFMSLSASDELILENGQRERELTNLNTMHRQNSLALAWHLLTIVQCYSKIHKSFWGD